MSDRVTNAEVEDVLSSIRRLVSDEHRPTKSASADGSMTAENPQPSTVISDRLVLTQALRVTEAPVPPQQTAEDTADAPESDVGLADVAGQEALDIAAAQVIEETSEDQEFEEEAEEVSDGLYEPAPWRDANARLYDAADLEPDDEDVPVPAETAPAEDPKAAILSAKIAALETAIGKISDTWEPDELGESDYAGTAPQQMAWEEDTPEPEKPTPFSRPILAPVTRNIKDEDLPEDFESFDHIGSSEAAEAAESPAEESEPEIQTFSSQRTVPTSGADRTPEPAVDATLPEPKVEGSHVEPVDAETALDADLAEDTSLLDEDALRDLVSDIVREELQGALGERITRNVRKLVRREIHRALAAQELE